MAVTHRLRSRLLAVLITCAMIRRKFFELHGSVPGNVQIQTWFSLLIEHGIKPFQGRLFEWDVAGMLLDSKRSGLRYKNGQGFPVYWGENKF
jgi:DNA helicase-2/ATP-dependent DNA helicase PcrA